MSKELVRVFFDEPNWDCESFRPKLDLQGEQAAGAAAAAASLQSSDNSALLNGLDKVIENFAQNLHFLLGPLSDQLDPVIVDTSGNKDVINWMNTLKIMFIAEHIPFVQDVLRLVPPFYETVPIASYPPGSFMSPSDSFIVLKRLRSNIVDLVHNYDTMLHIPTLLADSLSAAKESHHVCLIVADKLVSVFQSPEFQAVDHIMDLSRAFETCWPPSLPQIYNEEMRRLVFTLKRGHFRKPGENNERLEFLGDTILNTAAFLFVRQCNRLRTLPRAREYRMVRKLRKTLTRNETIGEWSTEYHLPERTGRGVRGKRVADLFEAYVGGLFLDRGMAVVQKWLFKVFSGYLGEGIEITLERAAGKRGVEEEEIRHKQELKARKRWMMRLQHLESVRRNDEVASASRWPSVRVRGGGRKGGDTRAAVRLADIYYRKRARAVRSIMRGFSMTNPV